MSRAPISSRRYVPLIINGQRQSARDQVTLHAKIVASSASRGSRNG